MKRSYLAGAALAAVLLTLFLWHRHDDTIVDAMVRAANDSAAVAVRRADNALTLNAQIRATNDSLTTIAADAQAKSEASLSAANRLRAERQRLLARVTASDSSIPPADTTTLARALTLSIAESDSLRASLGVRDGIEQTLKTQIGNLNVANDTLSASLVNARGVIAQQTAVIARMEPKCRVGPLPCPSRTVTAIGTALLVLVVRR